MKTSILAATAAIAFAASPAMAGGDLLGGVTGAVSNGVGSLGGAGNCLCETVKGVLGNAGSDSVEILTGPGQIIGNDVEVTGQTHVAIGSDRGSRSATPGRGS